VFSLLHVAFVAASIKKLESEVAELESRLDSVSFLSRVPTGQGKLENVREFVLSGKCQEKILFLRSQGK